MSTATLEHQAAPWGAEGAEAGTWHTVCDLAELEPLWAEAAVIEGIQIAIVRLPDDRVYAVDHWDPRAGANVMARGIVGSAQGQPTLASPIFKQVYDLTTGQCISEEEAPSLRTYPVDVVEGLVRVQV